ncbi:MAG: hypothetical protein PVJ67_03620 [Candidatus Pacearchaeota archaeon]|jgi:hypothetical protein
MKKGILLTAPRHDIVTEYLSIFSAPIEDVCRKKNVFCKTLKGKSVNKEEFTRAMNKLDCKMVFLNGHGSEEAIAGHKDEIIVTAGENEEILKERIVYARSCEAASILGEKIIKNSNGCFIGYTLPFEFYYNENWVGNPIKDKTAKLFLESSNLVPLSIIKGNSSEEAHNRAKKQMLKNIKKVLRTKTKESFAIAESLWNNYLGQTILGNKKIYLKIGDGL